MSLVGIDIDVDVDVVDDDDDDAMTALVRGQLASIRELMGGGFL